MKISLVALTATLVLGLLLVLAYIGDDLVPLHALIDLHLAWGLLGWAGLLLAGVAYQVVPMFQITAEYAQRLRRWFVWVVLSLLIAWSLTFLHLRAIAWLPGLGLATAFMGFAIVTLRLQRRRLRRLPDVTVDFWYFGLACLLAAAGLWLLREWAPQVMHLQKFHRWWGVLVLVGGVGAIISGMLYKIVPFLIWLHLNNRMQQAGQWQGNIPTVRQVIAEPSTRRHLRLHIAATLMLLLAVNWPTLMHYPAMLALAAAYVTQWWVLFGAVRRYRAVLREVGI